MKVRVTVKSVDYYFCSTQSSQFAFIADVGRNLRLENIWKDENTSK